MPIETAHPLAYLCTVCARSHSTWNEAQKCEQKGAKPFRFHKNQVVGFKHLDREYLAVVLINGGENEDINPHLEPLKVWLRTDFALLDQSGPSPRVNYGEFFTDKLVEKIYRNKSCPLCNHEEVVNNNKSYFFADSATSVFLIETVEHSSCRQCKTLFFTQPQLEAMLAKASEMQAANNIKSE